ncbi:MAG: DDE-type integrase/transposase/recombinase, partial [Gammaproteobacteria bacterium]|nr:DDE-type integrase/transposase/recombinase [Gammaproteobacteria bacterium]
LSRTGTYPRRRRHKPAATRRAQPRQLSGEEEQAVLDLATTERYQDASVRVIHATELNHGRPLPSVSTIYRILRRHQQSRERRAQRPPQRHAVPRVIARAPNQAWSWDITKLPTFERGVYLNLYQVLDLFSRYPVAWMISRKENAALARHLFEQALSAHQIEPGTLVIHQDRGAPMIAHSYRDFLDGYGVHRSYSRPRVSNDNPYSEAQFKTLKYSPSYPGRFRDIDHARAWVCGFLAEYQHRPHEGLSFYTPADVFEGRVAAVHAQRQASLDVYYAQHPERFPKGRPLAKTPPAKVCINPDDGITVTADMLKQDNTEIEYAHSPVVTTEKMN